MPFTVGKGCGMLGDSRNRGTISAHGGRCVLNEVVKVAEQLDESKYRHEKKCSFRESDRGERGGRSSYLPTTWPNVRAADASRRPPGRCTIECRIVCATRVLRYERNQRILTIAAITRGYLPAWLWKRSSRRKESR